MMAQHGDEKLSELVSGISLKNGEVNTQYRSSSGGSNKNRRRGVNSHLYSKANGANRGNKSNFHRNHQQQYKDEIHSQDEQRESYPTESLKFQPNTYDSSFHPHQKRDPLHDDQQPKKRNTETFKPSHRPTDMRILASHGNTEKYMREITSRDVIVVHGLYCDESDLSIYNKLIDETKKSGIESTNLWQLWHGDSHLIADDKKKWKDCCPTFKLVLDKIQHYFDMDIKATRMNWYRDSSEWKPFHHDAAAIKEDKAREQNFTVAVSFGAERDAAFEHASTRTVISMPQPNGTVYTFGKDVNVIWRHGILQIPPDKYHDRGRISIIAWGAVKQTQI